MILRAQRHVEKKEKRKNVSKTFWDSSMPINLVAFEEEMEAILGGHNFNMISRI